MTGYLRPSNKMRTELPPALPKTTPASLFNLSWTALFSENGKTNPLAGYHLHITVTHLRNPVSA